MLLSDEKYGRQHDCYSCRDHYHAATEYELFLKPHHRLDRKSSRGMIYENEELRLRTININAEIERGQYDIKKLKRENELLKKEIWCLRDEYEKLDKLLKEKEINFSSSSTTSDSESCSSCADDSEDVENTQNVENVQKTNVKNLNRNFEALSVVPEESTENSDKTSTRTSIPNADFPPENDVLQADQSYPTAYEQTPTLKCGGGQKGAPKHFFSLDKMESTSPLPNVGDKCIYPGEFYNGGYDNKSQQVLNGDGTNFYQNIVLVPKLMGPVQPEKLEKRGTDILVKVDNKDFVSEPNGGGNEYLAQFQDDFPRYCSNFGTHSHSTFSNGGNLEELLNDIETISQDILAISNTNLAQGDFTTRRCKSDINPMDNRSSSCSEKPFKSELNVTLMPQPMPLIGLEKYKDIQRSMNTTPSKSSENLSGHSLQVFNVTEENLLKREFHQFQQSPSELSDFPPIHPSHIMNRMNSVLESPLPRQQCPNYPPYLSNLKDNYVNGDYFARYNPENFEHAEKGKPIKAGENVQKEAKRNTLIHQNCIDVPSSENDEICKSKPESTTKNVPTETTSTGTPSKPEPKQKLGLRKKVSIHFRGKRDKTKKKPETLTDSTKKQSPSKDKKTQEKPEDNKNEKSKINHQKTSSKDSNKTTSDSDTKNNPDNKKTEKNETNDKKQRKSVSVSPDRRKGREDKKTKKHKKDRMKGRRATVTSLDSRDQRGRSHSVNTERSNTYGGQFFYDDYLLNSERESMSSCDTLKTRQMNFSNVPIGGKVPWFGCWGNGCI